MKRPLISAAENVKTPDERPHLISWKEIAQYMRCGVRTVQRYEREFGLPVRRPTGKSRGSVIATRAEIDAWVAAAPIREAFRLVRVDRNSNTRSQTHEIESGVAAMRKLKHQMTELRAETRSALNLLIDRVSSIRLLMPPARSAGYEPLVNSGIGTEIPADLHFDRRRSADTNHSDGTLANPSGRRKEERRRNTTSHSTAHSIPQKPH